MSLSLRHCARKKSLQKSNLHPSWASTNSIQFHPFPSKVRSLQLAPGQLSARSPWLKPGDGNWPGLVANTFNDLLQLFLAGTALMLSHMKRRETSHQFVLSLFSAIVAYSCHSIRISQACGKLSWKLAPICSGR